MNPLDRKGDRRLGALALSLVVGWATLGAYVVHGSMPTNALELPCERQMSMTAWAPEGWKFFTRDPQEARAIVFVREDGVWHRKTAPNADVSNLFGVKRTSRASGIESGAVLSVVPSHAWHECEGAPTSCLEREASALVVHNASPAPSLCGEVGVVMQKPVPWAWAHSSERITMPSKIVRFEVTC